MQAQAERMTKEIEDLWSKHVDPLFEHGETCETANYYTPRPYVDTYNKGSNTSGFVYIVNPGRRVCFYEIETEGRKNV